MTVFAAFAIVRTPSGHIAMTTRAADRGEAGRYGLPGGKIDPGETAEEAARREAREEGWMVPASAAATIVSTQAVEDNIVQWVKFDGTATMLTEFKEKNRIKPVTGTLFDVSHSGYGNNHPDVVKACANVIR